MRFLRLLAGIPVIYFLFIVATMPISGCSKTTTVHDTILIKDTSCNLKYGLIAYYNFNGGNLNDSSGLNNHIALNVNTTKTTDRFGHANNAYSFDGVSSFMTVKNNPSLNPAKITMFAIFKVNGFYTGPCGGNQILSKGYPYDVNGFYAMGYFDYSSNCGTANIDNESFSGSYGDDIPLGVNAGVGEDSIKVKKDKWYFLTYTYDGKTAKLYINGILKDSLNKAVPFTANTNDIFIGKHENPPFPYYLNGVIDELRIYNRALPAEAVLQLNNLKE